MATAIGEVGFENLPATTECPAVEWVVCSINMIHSKQDYAVLTCPQRRAPPKVQKVSADDIQFSTDLRLTSLSFDLTAQALSNQDLKSKGKAKDEYPPPSAFSLCLLEVRSCSHLCEDVRA
jgi:hypothetical protein